ncbi:hypothetical protein GCM10022281_20850 [Sphingomonas rosea]|uniref:Transferrin-binding protein B C-lobe/N-lobe beta-barrel domain-containing protein n=1 Tax=Sphingomonas rosea TaxID=335605 RepID=A0ABP7UBQ3_9SPHN
MNLLGPLVSETFFNRNAEIALTADVITEAGTSTVAQKTLTIAYDAATAGYTLTVNGRTLTFLPSDIDSTQSNAVLTVYVKKNGTTATDTLTLLKPGTSGRFTYKYVGGAFWERSVLSGTTLNASAQSTVYGVPTPAAAVPRTGTASYGLDVVGYIVQQANVVGITGAGRMDVDFGKGILVASGTITKGPDPVTGNFRSDARISSTGNGFSGNFFLNEFGTNMSGTVEGAFFGPAADEVGASWTAQQSATYAASGVLLGRRDGTYGNTSFTTVSKNDLYSVGSARLDYRQTATAPQNGTASDAPLIISYSAATGTYTVIAPDRSVQFTGLGPNAVSGEVYAIGSTADDRLTINDVGTSYVRSGVWSSSAGVTGGTDIRLQHFIIGMPTTSAGVPRTGDGAYKIAIRGQAADADFANRMNFLGNGLMRINFGTGALTLDSGVNYTENYVQSGRPAATANGQLTGSGTLSSSANAFNGSLTLTGVGTYNGSFAGQFFGPVGQEVGANFKATDGAGGAAAGSFTGLRDDSILAADKGLAQLTQATTFKVDAVKLGQTTPAGIDLTYDPVAGTYRFNSKPYDFTSTGFDTTLTPADKVAAKSTAARTYYDKAGSDIGYTGYLSVPGSANPELALTYSSWGELRPNYNIPGYSGADRYLFTYGVATNPSTLPASGTASYSGLALGGGRFDPIFATVDVTGTSAFQINFGTMSWTGSVSLLGAQVNSGNTPTTIGTFGFGGQVASNGFFGNGTSSTISGAYGNMSGRFYGPGAAEVGATWMIAGPDGAGGQMQLSGIAAAKKN